MSTAGNSRTLAGRYRLEEVIGRGGMSTVYRATDLALDRTVAVKVATDPLVERDPVHLARFQREARVAAALSHPAAVTVYDAGHDGPTRFIVMEYVEGRSLADVLREEGPLEAGRAAWIAEQIADALAAAHAAGIVHRDIKPGNVMVSAGDRVKVLDFGIARFSDAAALTRTAAVLGTAPYMAPEQAMGQPADARSDIYSLGCVLYEMLTGQPPFMADLPAAVMHQHVRVAPKPPSAVNAAVPPALNALVLQMLAKSPEDRPQTAAEVRDRLAAFRTAAEAEPTVEALAVSATVPQVATVSQAATMPLQDTRAPPPTRVPPPAGRSSRGLWAAVAALGVLLLGAAVALALTGGGSSQSSSTPSHPSSPATTPATHATTQTSHSTSTPSTSTSTSTSTTTSSGTTSSTPTTTVTSANTTASTTTAPPGQATTGTAK